MRQRAAPRDLSAFLDSRGPGTYGPGCSPPSELSSASGQGLSPPRSPWLPRATQPKCTSSRKPVSAPRHGSSVSPQHLVRTPSQYLLCHCYYYLFVGFHLQNVSPSNSGSTVHLCLAQGASPIQQVIDACAAFAEWEKRPPWLIPLEGCPRDSLNGCPHPDFKENGL